MKKEDYRRKITELLEYADERKMRLIYIYIKTILGLD